MRSKTKMVQCHDCPLEEKLIFCCKINPITLKNKAIILDGQVRSACTNLDEEGLCSIYENRSDICTKFDCDSHRASTEIYRNF